MRRSIVALTVASFLTVLTNSCGNNSEDCHSTLRLKNNSDKTIYYVSSLKKGFFNYNPTSPDHAAEYRIAPSENRNIRIGITLSCWEQVLENAGGKLYIYIYDAEYLDTNSWDKAKNNFIKKYVLTVGDMKKLNWQVVYP